MTKVRDDITARSEDRTYVVAKRRSLIDNTTTRKEFSKMYNTGLMVKLICANIKHRHICINTSDKTITH